MQTASRTLVAGVFGACALSCDSASLPPPTHTSTFEGPSSFVRVVDSSATELFEAPVQGTVTLAVDCFAPDCGVTLLDADLELSGLPISSANGHSVEAVTAVLRRPVQTALNSSGLGTNVREGVIEFEANSVVDGEASTRSLSNQAVVVIALNPTEMQLTGEFELDGNTVAVALDGVMATVGD